MSKYHTVAYLFNHLSVFAYVFTSSLAIEAPPGMSSRPDTTFLTQADTELPSNAVLPAVGQSDTRLETAVVL